MGRVPRSAPSRCALLAASAVLLVTLQLGVARAAPTGAAPTGKDEIEEVEPVAAAPAAKPAQPGGVLELAGKLHPLLVHLPIGWLLLLLLVDSATLLFRRPWAKAGQLLLVGSVLAMLPAVATGLLRAASVVAGADAQLTARVGLHRNLALLLTALAVLALVVRVVRRNQLERGWKLAYLALLAGMGAVLTVVGHLGGELVFGESYLPF